MTGYDCIRLLWVHSSSSSEFSLLGRSVGMFCLTCTASGSASTFSTVHSDLLALWSRVVISSSGSEGVNSFFSFSFFSLVRSSATSPSASRPTLSASLLCVSSQVCSVGPAPPASDLCKPESENLSLCFLESSKVVFPHQFFDQKSY